MDNFAVSIAFFQEMNLLHDVTDRAKQLKFDPSHTYQAIVPYMVIDGRQYAFPCNVTAVMMWVNKKTFEEHGVELPPRRWDTQTFERIGKQLVDAANPPDKPRKVFFANSIDVVDLFHSEGLDVFNETLTRCILDDPRYVDGLKLLYKWTYEDHLLPTKAEQLSFSTEGSFGGSVFQLFHRGNYAMVRSGRWSLIQFRRFGRMEMAVSEPPHMPGGMPNAHIGIRAATIYNGSDHPELAELFMAYLASESYCMQIVRDGDSLPPNPKYAQTEAFKRPPDYPNEWGLHEVFDEAARTIAVPIPMSPYVQTLVYRRKMTDAEEAVMNDRLTPAEAATRVQRQINDEIDRTLEEQPKLRARYEAAVERQKQIDALRAAGEPVPIEWIANPYHRKWYEHQGWLAQEATD